MKKDKIRRGKVPPERVLLYLHGALSVPLHVICPGALLTHRSLPMKGGAHFFSSRASQIGPACGPREMLTSLAPLAAHYLR